MAPRNRLRRALRYATPVIVMTNAVLVWTGALDLGQAVLAALALELVCAACLVFLLIGARGTYRSRRAASGSRAQAFAAAIREILPPPLWSLAKHEIAIFASLALVLRGRTDIPPESRSFRYGKSQAPLFAVVVIVSLLEIGLIEWLIPWATVRIVLAVLSVYGAIWAFAFYQLLRRKPHYLAGEQFTIRCGAIVRLDVPLDAIHSVTRELKSWGNRFYEATGDAIVIKPGGSTDVRLRLHHPIQLHTDRGVLTGTSVCLAADDPDAMVAALREELEPTAS